MKGGDILSSEKSIAVSVNRSLVKPADKEYRVSKLKKSMKIDANWNKSEWKKIETIKIENYMGTVSPFKPTVEAKMIYDMDNVYVIFQ